MQRAYDNNSGYQRPPKAADNDIIESIKNEEDFKARCGKMDQYANFLAFFQREITEKGVGSVVNKYIFARTELADDMLVRLFGGMLSLCVLRFKELAAAAQ